MDAKDPYKDISIAQGFGSDWELLLNQIAKAGYSYGYTSYVDIPTGKQYFVVDAFRDDGPRIAVAKPTMTEAVQELIRLLGLEIDNDE